MSRLYSIDELRQVKGLGNKTIDRIVEQFNEDDYISKYDSSIHINPNTLVNGDMLEVMNGIPDKSIDLILTDLPYGRTQNRWDTVIPFDKLWKQYERVIKDKGVILLFSDGMFMADIMKSNQSLWRYNLVWDKVLPSGFLNANRQPLRSHEEIVVFYKEQPQYNPQKSKGKKNNSQGVAKLRENNNYGDFNFVDNGELLGDMKHPKSIVSYSRSHSTKMKHPTEKPIDLIKYLIKTYTNKDELVLDSTMGSGTTCVGAKELGRNYIGIELDETYYNVAKSRVEE